MYVCSNLVCMNAGSRTCRTFPVDVLPWSYRYEHQAYKSETKRSFVLVGSTKVRVSHLYVFLGSYHRIRSSKIVLSVQCRRHLIDRHTQRAPLVLCRKFCPELRKPGSMLLPELLEITQQQEAERPSIDETLYMLDHTSTDRLLCLSERGGLWRCEGQSVRALNGCATLDGAAKQVCTMACDTWALLCDHVNTLQVWDSDAVQAKG